MKKIRFKLYIIFAMLFSFTTNVFAKKTATFSCGNIEKIPKKIPELTSWGINIIQIVTPVILIIVSMVDLVKAMSSQKKDEIKNGQQILIKRIIVAVLIFFVVAGVKLIISLVANSLESKGIIDCIDCFVSNNCK